MKYILPILLLIAGTSSFAKEIALTFDDIPRAATEHFDGQQRADHLIKALKTAGVSTTFFANSERLDAEGTLRLKKYVAAGIGLANHTHSHPNLNESSSQDYVEDFRKADKILSVFSGFTQWFRFPYLREGDTIEKRDALRTELKNKNYLNAYITVNNYDWYMDVLFQKALKEKRQVNMEALKNTYIQVLLDSVEYYDDMAMKVLGRSPKHVLLLHENDLAALFVGDFVTALKAKGWKIISPQEAYTDQITSYQYSDPLKFNPGRIGEIAKASGWPRNKLWHEACDEGFLEDLFLKNGVYAQSRFAK